MGYHGTNALQTLVKFLARLMASKYPDSTKLGQLDVRLKVCYKFNVCCFVSFVCFWFRFWNFFFSVETLWSAKKEKTFFNNTYEGNHCCKRWQTERGMYSINYQWTLLLFLFELDFTCIASSWDSSRYHYHKNAYPRKTYKNFIIHVSSVILKLTQLEVSSCLLTT